MYCTTSCLSTETRKTLTTTLIQCHFEISCTSWYAGVLQTFKNKLQNYQSKTVKLIKKLSIVGFLNIENRVN